MKNDFTVSPDLFKLKNEGKVESEYLIQAHAGDGSFGLIRKVTHIASNQLRALKQIKK